MALPVAPCTYTPEQWREGAGNGVGRDWGGRNWEGGKGEEGREGWERKKGQEES